MPVLAKLYSLNYMLPKQLRTHLPHKGLKLNEIDLLYYKSLAMPSMISCFIIMLISCGNEVIGEDTTQLSFTPGKVVFNEPELESLSSEAEPLGFK